MINNENIITLPTEKQLENIKSFYDTKIINSYNTDLSKEIMLK